MGNRALIIMEKPTEALPIVPAIYVHWNGGIESVLAMCQVCKDRGFRTPGGDASYAMARMVGVWHEFFGLDDSLSLGVLTYDGKSDHGDNGVYLLGGDWEVIEHYRHHWDDDGITELPKVINPNNKYQADMVNGLPPFMKGLLERYKAARKQYESEDDNEG